MAEPVGEALGMIETKGLVGMIEAADAPRIARTGFDGFMGHLTISGQN